MIRGVLIILIINSGVNVIFSILDFIKHFILFIHGVGIYNAYENIKDANDKSVYLKAVDKILYEKLFNFLFKVLFFLMHIYLLIKIR